MGHTNTYNNYANYSNTWRGTKDDEKKWTLDLPFNSEYFESNGTLKNDIELSGDVLKQLRQHIKAIDSQFEFAGTPLGEAITDSDLATDQFVEHEHLNEGEAPTGANNALLDEMSEIGILGSVSGVADGQPITKAKIDEIASQLKTAAVYNNYSNYFNSHANYQNGYANKVNYVNGTGTGRGWMCHRNHSNYSYLDSGSNHLNTAVAYSNSVYLNSFTDPATYSDNL